MGLRVKDEKFLYFWSSLKNPNFRGGESGGGGCPWKTNIKGGIGQFPDLKEGLARKKGWCFWGGGEGSWQCNAQCLKMHFQNNKSVLLKEIQHASKLLELIYTDSFLLKLAEYYFLRNIH